MGTAQAATPGWGEAVVGWFSRPFDVLPDARQALGLSAGLWSFAVFLASVFAILAGYVHVLGEYLTLVWGTVTGVAFAGVLFLLFRALAGRASWLAVLILVPSVVVTGILQMWADYAGQFAMNALFDGMVMPDSSWTAQAKVALVYVSIYATNAALFWVAFTSRRIQEQRQTIVEREAAALRAELRVLRMQLNPHFMFNALSALSTLILTGRQAEATEMVDRLSDFLRAALEADALKDIPLADELSVLDAYLAVESVRFGDRLDLSIQCHPEVESALVPNLLLQPLVENAMKYGVEPSLAPVRVAVTAHRAGDRLRLEVRDDGATLRTGVSRPATGHGVGLGAVRQRLALRFAEAASLAAAPDGSGFAAVIEMPLLTPTD